MSLEVKQLSFHYGKTLVIDDLSFTLDKGEVLGIIGPNGAGKSTLIKLLTRILKPARGNVFLDGQAINIVSRLELAKRVAVVPQAADLPETFSAKELVLMGRTPHLGFLAAESEHDHKIVEAAMRRTDTWEFRDRPVSELSGGERQRVLFARALSQEADYLLLDEPTSHLDLKYQVELLRFVKLEAVRGLGALVVLHDLNLAAKTCDRLLLLSQGHCVAEGSVQDVLSQERLTEVYQTEVEVLSKNNEAPIILPRL